MSLPTVICSSVIRSAQQGDSHGGMYIVNLETETVRQVVDWNTPDIDWTGRGLDRGLRGIGFWNDTIICAASDEVFFYDQDFKILKSFRNPYLKHCHEVFIEDDRLYLSSTGFDAVLVFDLVRETFERGYVYRRNTLGGRFVKRLLKGIGFENLVPNNYIFGIFDPMTGNGPPPGDTVHLNNVFCYNQSIYFSGTTLHGMMRINTSTPLVLKEGSIPTGTHNVRITDRVIVFNDTSHDCVQVIDRETGNTLKFDIIRYDIEELSHTNLSKDYARQGFGRGLCMTEQYVIGGSSPSTISVYSLKENRLIKAVNISKDIRNSIHGLEIYPF